MVFVRVAAWTGSGCLPDWHPWDPWGGGAGAKEAMSDVTLVAAGKRGEEGGQAHSAGLERLSGQPRIPQGSGSQEEAGAPPGPAPEYLSSQRAGREAELSGGLCGCRRAGPARRSDLPRPSALSSPRSVDGRPWWGYRVAASRVRLSLLSCPWVACPWRGRRGRVRGCCSRGPEAASLAVLSGSLWGRRGQVGLSGSARPPHPHWGGGMGEVGVCPQQWKLEGAAHTLASISLEDPECGA